MTDRPPPLTPADCDLSGFGFMPWDFTRFRQSGLMDASAEAIVAAILLYGEAWQSVPAGSLPNDDRALARAAGFGRSVTEWLTVKDEAMRGFVECSDGRLYHRVVAEKVREAWARKLEQRHRTFCAAIRKHNERYPEDRRTSPSFDQWNAMGRPDKPSSVNTRPAPQQGDLALPEDERPVRAHAPAPPRTGAETVPKKKPNESNKASRVTGGKVTRDTPPKSRVQTTPRDRDNKGQGDSKTIEESPHTPLPSEIAAELCELGGVRLTTDKARDNATAEVESWLSQGIAPDTMRDAVTAFTTKARTPSYSLHRFDGEVRLRHAKRAKPAKGKPPSVRAHDDDDQRIRELRLALRQRCGARTYDSWIKGNAFTLNGGGVIVTCPSQFIADWTETNLKAQLGEEAAPLGFNAVHIRTAQGERP